jgi:hypothetical protein
MNLVDDELQAKIDAMGELVAAMGTNLAGIIIAGTKLEEIFPIKDDGNKRSGEESASSKPALQEKQDGSNPKT